MLGMTQAVSQTIIPRWYQNEAAQAPIDYFARGFTDPAIIALPTGTGKSLVQSLFIYNCMMMWPRLRFVEVTHVQELIEQNAADLIEFWPTAPVGVFSAGLKQRVVHTPIVIGGIQTMINDVEILGHRDVILIDEAHLMSDKDESMYVEFVKRLRAINPKIKIIKLTATPWRTGQGRISGVIVYDMTIMERFNLLIAQGYMCTIRPKHTHQQIDVSDVGTARGDYDMIQLRAKTDVARITNAAMDEVIYYGQDKASWLTFASGVEHAEHISLESKRRGISTVCVHGKMSRSERKDAIVGWKQGKYRHAVNYGVMTTGVNHPGLDLINVLRATQSPGLWVQILGRLTRPLYAPYHDLSTDAGRLLAIANSRKPYGLVLDFAGNTARLGPINDPVIPTKRGNKTILGVAPVKICPECGVYNHTRATLCANNPPCTHIFESTPKISETAGMQELLRTEAVQIETFSVDHVNYATAQRHGSPTPYLRVSYCCGAFGMQKYDERVMLEHPGSIRHVAREWWRLRYMGTGRNQSPKDFAGYVPDTVKEALELARFLRVPAKVRVQLNLKHPEVVGYEAR